MRPSIHGLDHTRESSSNQSAASSSISAAGSFGVRSRGASTRRPFTRRWTEVDVTNASTRMPARSTVTVASVALAVTPRSRRRFRRCAAAASSLTPWSTANRSTNRSTSVAGYHSTSFGNLASNSYDHAPAKPGPQLTLGSRPGIGQRYTYAKPNSPYRSRPPDSITESAHKSVSRLDEQDGDFRVR